MTNFRVRVRGDRWETEYTVEASGWPTAIARAIKLWKKSEGKGSRTQELSVKAIKQTNLTVE